MFSNILEILWICVFYRITLHLPLPYKRIIFTSHLLFFRLSFSFYILFCLNRSVSIFSWSIIDGHSLSNFSGSLTISTGSFQIFVTDPSLRPKLNKFTIELRYVTPSRMHHIPFLQYFHQAILIISMFIYFRLFNTSGLHCVRSFSRGPSGFSTARFRSPGLL